MPPGFKGDPGEVGLGRPIQVGPGGWIFPVTVPGKGPKDPGLPVGGKGHLYPPTYGQPVTIQPGGHVIIFPGGVIVVPPPAQQPKP